MTTTNKTYTAQDIAAKACQAVLVLVKLYNAHAYVGEMLDIAERTVTEQTDSNKTYTEKQAKEILALVDDAARDYLD